MIKFKTKQKLAVFNDDLYLFVFVIEKRGAMSLVLNSHNSKLKKMCR